MTSWHDVVENKDSMIRPLYDKRWVLNEVGRIMVDSGDYESDEIDEELSDCDGSIIVGRILDTDDDEANMMFGFMSERYLDDCGHLDYLLYEMFKPLTNLNVFEPGDMESVAGLYFDEVSKKEVLEVLTYIIGESLSDPAITAKDKISTQDCKEHLVNTWNLARMKRTKKVKIGLIEVREFENDDGDEATILSYNGRIINSYPLTCSDYE